MWDRSVKIYWQLSTDILSTECALEIQSTCLNFYKTTFKELLKPLSYNDSLFEQL